MTEQEVFDLAMRKAFGSETGDESGATPGVSNHPSDHGGLTRYGITLAFLRGLGLEEGDLDGDGDVDVQDVLAATPAKARRAFRMAFWQPSGASDFATLYPDLACEHFDFAVVRGASSAVRALQRAANDLGEPLEVDGVYGDLTHRAVVRLCDDGFGKVATLQAVRRRQCEQFVRIVERDRSQIVFLLGWVRRALDID